MSDPAGTNGYRRGHGRGFRRPGWWLRIALLLTWAGLYGHHASGHLLLSLGLVERRDVSTILHNHQKYRYRYDMVTVTGEQVGNIFLEYQFVDTNWESSMALDLENIDFMPGMGALLSRMGGFGSREVHLEFTSFLDDQFRLSRLEASGHVLGIDGTFSGEIDHTGLVGTVKIPSLDVVHEVHQPAFIGSATAGLDLAHALPPGLVVGDRFQTEVIAIDYKPPFLQRRPVVYEVVARLVDPDGTTLNRVEIMQDGRTMGELTADLDGVVRHTTHLATGLQLHLRAVFHNGGKIWPKDEIITIPSPDDQAAD
jgi:hypothetical protein